MEDTIRIVTLFSIVVIRLAGRAPSYRSEAPGLNGTRIAIKEGQKASKSGKNSGRWCGLQSRAWSTCDIVSS